MKHKTSFFEEQLLWNQGCEYVIGIDEVGRGAFAGPVVAAAVVYEKTCVEKKLLGITDSKLLTPVKREYLVTPIQNTCFAHAIAEVSVEVINEMGIGKATFMAMTQAVESIMNQVVSSKNKKPIHNTRYILPTTYLLVDGFKIPPSLLPTDIQQKAIVKGDQKSLSIASASIIAKVYRDNLMRQLHTQYLKYGFVDNKGYGTLFHCNAIKKHGLSKIHRTSFNLEKYL